MDTQYTETVWTAEEFFDPAFYANQVTATGTSALEHYERQGWRDGLNPSREFDTRFYMSQNPDVAARGICPLTHFIDYGQFDGRRPRPDWARDRSLTAEGRQLRALINLIAEPRIYHASTGAHPKSDIDIGMHYLSWGARKGATVTRRFNRNYYLKSNADLRRCHIDPLIHYLLYGHREGRKPNAWRKLLPPPDAVLEKAQEIRDNFDTTFYLAQMPELAGTTVDPVLHYLSFGADAGLQPNREAPATATTASGTASPEAEGPASEVTADIVALAESVVDPGYYTEALGSETIAPYGSPARHFAAAGWREECNPNPFTHLGFVRRTAPEAFSDFKTMIAHLQTPIHLNSLMKKPMTLDALRAALAADDPSLRCLFAFDIDAYAADQHDVLASLTMHPLEHLFRWGLRENRLRRGAHIHPYLKPDLTRSATDLAFVSDQGNPLEDCTFAELSLAQPQASIEADLAKIRLGIGIVTYKNDRDELEPLIASVARNLEGQDFTGWLAIWDNSPDPIDFGWAADASPGLRFDKTECRENIGFGPGHNALMAAAFEAGATHYLGLNPDGHLLPGAIEAALRFASTKPGPALIELDTEPLSHPKHYHPVTGATDWVSGAAFLMDREVYTRTRGFDPEFPMYCEDNDLSFRAFEAGCGLYVAPRARFFHDTTDRMYDIDPVRQARMLIGEWYLCRKWGNPARANAVHAELLRLAPANLTLPPPPDPQRRIHPRIGRLMEETRFSTSRFWA